MSLMIKSASTSFRSLYTNAKTMIEAGCNDHRDVHVGVHRDLVLSPLFFIIVLRPQLIMLGKAYLRNFPMQTTWLWLQVANQN